MKNNSGAVDGTKLQIRQQMRLGNTDKVIQLLCGSAIPQADVLSNRINDLYQQYQSGRIDAETWSRAQLQFYEAILDLKSMQVARASAALAVSIRLQLRFLVEGHEIRKALVLCEAVGDTSILMQAQYEIGRKQYEEGTIGLASWELIQHKTKYLLWELAEQLPGEEIAGKSIWKKIKKWFA